MIFLFWLLLVLMPLQNLSTPQDHLALTSEHGTQKMKVVIALLDQKILNESMSTERIAFLLQKMLARYQCSQSGFNVELEHWPKKPSKKEIKQLSKRDVPLILFLTSSKTDSLEWRLYDTQQGTMIQGKKITLSKNDPQRYAEYIADALWPVLTGQEGFFSTRIAFCKEDTKGSSNKSIYVQVPYCASGTEESFAVCCLLSNSKAFGLGWNKDPYNPVILYSKSEHSKVVLKSVSLNGVQKMVSNLEGINMLPCFSPDGTKGVYCLSVKDKINIFLFERTQQGSMLKRITHNNGNNISPTLCDNGDIVFCSDFQKKGPQIYWYRAESKEVEPITTSGYCSNPHFSHKNNKIVYTKLDKSYMQLWVYDCTTKKHTQITQDPSNKHECSWSSCGNYIVFTWSKNKESRIALLNMVTDERTFLTAAGERCSHPAWSGQLVLT